MKKINKEEMKDVLAGRWPKMNNTVDSVLKNINHCGHHYSMKYPNDEKKRRRKADNDSDK